MEAADEIPNVLQMGAGMGEMEAADEIPNVLQMGAGMGEGIQNPSVDEAADEIPNVLQIGAGMGEGVQNPSIDEAAALANGGPGLWCNMFYTWTRMTVQTPSWFQAQLRANHAEIDRISKLSPQLREAAIENYLTKIRHRIQQLGNDVSLIENQFEDIFYKFLALFVAITAAMLTVMFFKIMTCKSEELKIIKYLYPSLMLASILSFIYHFGYLARPRQSKLKDCSFRKSATQVLLKDFKSLFPDRQEEEIDVLAMELDGIKIVNFNRGLFDRMFWFTAIFVFVGILLVVLFQTKVLCRLV